MTKALKVAKTHRKFWVLSTICYRAGEICPRILATCKTEREARKLRDQKDNDFEYAFINSVDLYQNEG